MCIELRDGNFTPIQPFDSELLEKFKELAEAGEGVALHVGSEGFLRDRVMKRSLEERVSDLEKKVEEQTISQGEYIGNLHIPTQDEIKLILKETDHDTRKT